MSTPNSTGSKVLQNFYGKANAFVLYEEENEDAKRCVKCDILPVVEKCNWEARDAFCPGESAEANLAYLKQHGFLFVVVICSAFAANDLLWMRFQQIRHIKNVRLIPIVLKTDVPDSIRHVSSIRLSGEKDDDSDELKRLEMGLRAQPPALTSRRRRRRRRRRRQQGDNAQYKLELFRLQLKFSTAITNSLPLYYGLFLMQFLALFASLVFDLVLNDEKKIKNIFYTVSRCVLLLLQTVVGCIVPTKLRQCSKNINENVEIYTENLTEEDLKSVETFMREQEVTTLQPCDHAKASSKYYDCLFKQLNMYLISSDKFCVYGPLIHYLLLLLQLCILGYFEWDGALPLFSGYFSYMRHVYWFVSLTKAISFFFLLFCSHLWASLCFHSSAKVAIDINNALRARETTVYSDVPSGTGKLAVVACNLDGSLQNVFRNYKYILGVFAAIQLALIVSLLACGNETSEFDSRQEVTCIIFLIMLGFSELCLCCTTRKWKSIGILVDVALVVFAGILRYNERGQLVFRRIFDFLEFGLLRLLFFSILICQIVRNVHLKKGPIRQENLKEIGCIVGLMLLLSPEVFYMRLFF
ncbi:uncharacterized protein [Oscarella lobularis]|uniref:uncharacterized protein n=1 Tax=Oscarella lobularis TaxID=121494 RepID=UPI0033136DE7